MCDEMAVRLSHPLRYPAIPHLKINKMIGKGRKIFMRNSASDFNDSRKLVLEVKEKLEKNYQDLPVGKNGRDDENMIFWYLKDRRFSVEEACEKLTKAIRWRKEFGVSELSEETVKRMAKIEKAFVHHSLDVSGRPVLLVVANKHFPTMQEQDIMETQNLCVFLIEKALSKLPAGNEQILGIFDFRGFGSENADLMFLTFLLTKPLLKSYASLVKFCSVDTVRRDYFKEATLPTIFKK